MKIPYLIHLTNGDSYMDEFNASLSLKEIEEIMMGIVVERPDGSIPAISYVEKIEK